MNPFFLITIWALLLFIFARDNRFKLKKCNIEDSYSLSVSSMFIICFPLVLFAAFRTDNIGDTFTYKTMIDEIPNNFYELKQFIVDYPKDIGFSCVVSFIKNFISDNYTVIFFIIAAISIIGVIVFYRDYSVDFAMSICLFVISTDYVSWMLNGMRQFLAVTIVLFCGPLIIKKDYFKSCVIVILASLIHVSAIVFIPFVFVCSGKPWNKKIIIFICFIVLILTSVSSFVETLNYLLSDTIYSQVPGYFANDDGANILRTIVYSIPMILGLVGRKRIREVNDNKVNLCVNMSIVTVCFYLISNFTSGIFMGRLPIYFSMYNYALLPWEIKTLFVSKSATFLTVVTVLCYLIFGYYQLHVIWSYI